MGHICKVLIRSDSQQREDQIAGFLYFAVLQGNGFAEIQRLSVRFLNVQCTIWELLAEMHLPLL